jgi:hypothetical protein
MRKLLSATAIMLALATPGLAATIDTFAVTPNTSTLTLVAVPPPGNQPLNTPCLICPSNQPQQPAGFGFNNYSQGGVTGSFTEFSTSVVGGALAQDQLGVPYQLSFLLAFLASQNSLSFNLGIDVNTGTGQGAEVLERFAIVDVGNHVILAQYIGPTALPTANNGSGFPDYLLTGFDINRADINANSQIEFFARWSNASDGGEQFFLVPDINPQAVPAAVMGGGLPGLLMGMLGLFGLQRYRRRRSA